MSLLEERHVYKPFRYPWAYEAWLTQQRIHWLPEEVPLADDVKDWAKKLTDGERNLLTQIFRFFVQADVEVNNCYMKHYSRVFKPTEVQMMLAAFSNMETIHISAYSHLLDTIGMPESEYEAFLKYKEMKDKYDYMREWGVETKADIAKTLAVFGAFTEGVQLFASFAILMNFPRFNKMKGMGQIITWSVRDETLHTNSIDQALPHLRRGEPGSLERRAVNATSTRPAKRSSITRTPSSTSPSRWAPSRASPPHEVKNYIRYIADRRLIAAQPAADLPHGQEPAALDGRDAERHRARELLREPRDGIFQGLDQGHLGRSFRLNPGARHRLRCAVRQ